MTLKKNVLEYGTVLSTYKSNAQSEKNKHKSITLTCVHFGTKKVSKGSEKVFEAHLLQASGTIIQQSHSASSVKNRSRNSTYKRVPLSSESDEVSKKKNRSTTKKCNCELQFTIIYVEETNRWFLRKRKSVSEENAFHTNHMYIQSQQINQSHHNIDEVVKKSLNSLIDSGTNVPDIQSHLKHQYNTNLSYHTIYNMRLTSKLCVNP